MTNKSQEIAQLLSEENNFDRAGDYSESQPSRIHKSSISISLRLPGQQLVILKEFARRRGIGYQTMMKEWLDDRIRQEALQVTEPQPPRGRNETK